MPKKIPFIGTHHASSRNGQPLVAAAMVPLLGLSAVNSTAQQINTGVGVFGEATRPNALRLDNAGLNDELLAVNINGYWGLLNQSIRLVAEPVFDWTDDGYDGLARATLNGKTGFLQGNGDWRFAPEFSEVDRFENGFAVFQDPDGGYGYLDKAKKIRHEPEFAAALRFKDGRAVVQVGDRLGYLDARMQLVTPLSFTAARSFHEGFAAVRLAQETDPKPQKKAVQKEGKGTDKENDRAENPKQSPPEGEEGPTGNRVGEEQPQVGKVHIHRPAVETKSELEYSGPWGYLNKAGRMVFVDSTGTVEALGDFNESHARFRVGEKWGYLDKNFRVAVEPIYEDARDFTNGVAAVKYDGRWGYIDRRFKVVVPFAYEEADDFDENLAMVRLDGKVGFIDRIGRIKIEPEFNSAEPFRNGVARVERDDSFAYIAITGFVFFDPRDALDGIVDVRNRETARLRSGDDRNPYNRIYLAPRPRKTLPAPYPPDYLYDEGLDVTEPWQLGSTP